MVVLPLPVGMTVLRRIELVSVPLSVQGLAVHLSIVDLLNLCLYVCVCSCECPQGYDELA